MFENEKAIATDLQVELDDLVRGAVVLVDQGTITVRFADPRDADQLNNVLMQFSSAIRATRPQARKEYRPC